MLRACSAKGVCRPNTRQTQRQTQRQANQSARAGSQGYLKLSYAENQGKNSRHGACGAHLCQTMLDVPGKRGTCNTPYLCPTLSKKALANATLDLSQQACGRSAEEADAQSLRCAILLDILGRQQKPLTLRFVVTCPSRCETKPEPNLEGSCWTSWMLPAKRQTPSFLPSQSRPQRI